VQGQEASVIVDEKNNPIPFVHVSINGDVYGKYSDENGVISWGSLSVNDTVKIYCIGFRAESILYELISDTIRLMQSTIQLSEFIVNYTKPIKEYGVFKINRHGLSGNVNGSINGVILSGIEKGKLASVWVHISKKSSKPINRLLLRISEVDSNTMTPLNSVLSEMIFIPCLKKGWVKVDLSEFNIVVSGAVFIGIESMPISGNKSVLYVKDFVNQNGFVGYGFGLIEATKNISRCYGREGVCWSTVDQLEKYPKLNLVPMIRIEVN
jgi:hypothetical protein